MNGLVHYVHAGSSWKVDYSKQRIRSMEKEICSNCFRDLGVMSEAESPVSDVVGELQKLRLKADELCQLSLSRSTISGMPKLVRKCRAELQFVERVSKLKSALSFSCVAYTLHNNGEGASDYFL